jgi:S-adenosylmethionine/arginine decarboxylase-like enzyme
MEPWGMLAAINVYRCDKEALADPASIRRFVATVIRAIGMQARGPLALDRFWDGELEGWAAMQFLETSSITVHVDAIWGRCFVDIFSSQAFDPDDAMAIAVEHFGGSSTVTVLTR